jgi:DNA-binding CsgD family transcriptional regulator/Tol biopolymer transport system component
MRAPLDTLTAREREVFALLRRGLTNEEIAQRLGISLDGAKYHVSQILSKLGVATREEAAAWQKEAPPAEGKERVWWGRWPVWAKIGPGAAVAAAALGVLGVVAIIWDGGPVEVEDGSSGAAQAESGARASAPASPRQASPTPLGRATPNPAGQAPTRPGQAGPTPVRQFAPPPPPPSFATPSTSSEAGVTELVSVNSAGIVGDGASMESSMSGDGRFVAFTSWASNLAPDDTNTFCDTNSDNLAAENCGDIFVYDRQTGTTSLVSLSSTGIQANGTSSRPSISKDGRFVVFESEASNLVPGDTGCPNGAVVSATTAGQSGCPDVFLRDRLTGTTERVSVNRAGEPANGDSLLPSVSDDGRFIAFQSSNSSNLGAPGQSAGVFVRDRQAASTVFAGNGVFPRISGSGRFVTFQSDAPDIVAGDANGGTDIFVHDLQLGVTERVSVDSSGNQATDDDPLLGGWLSSSFFPAITGDGRSVAFVSNASNLVTGDTNGAPDVFVHDRESGVTSRLSVNSNGSESNGDSYGVLAMSDEGRFVAFPSFASNLVTGDSTACQGAPDPRSCRDVFLHDRQSGSTERASVSDNGTAGDADSTTPAGISADGRFVAFQSFASNLAPGDTNTCPPSQPGSCQDIFVRERLATNGTLAVPAAVPRVAAPPVVHPRAEQAAQLLEPALSSRVIRRTDAYCRRGSALSFAIKASS